VLLDPYELSAGLFVRGLTNLKTLLTKAEHDVVDGSGETALLDARLAGGGRETRADHAPRDVHMYTLAAQVHWAAEGAKLAIGLLLGLRLALAPNDAKSIADLRERLDATITYLQGIDRRELESGLDRTVVIEQPRGSMSSSGRQFLAAYAIPHFFYHLTAAYGILRNEGVKLTMGDFLGSWWQN